MEEYLYQIDSKIMKERNSKDDHNSTSCFLERFAGKLNIITKHGEIRDEVTLKLPAIYSPHSSKRSNTMNFRDSKKSLFSSASECGRSLASKSAIINKRADKYLILNRERNFVDLSNSFLKDSCRKDLKISRLRHKTIQPLSAVFPASRKMAYLRHESNQNDPSVYTETRKNQDYSSFLNQLDKVSRIVKNKKMLS